jgi:hypothetical protein
MRWRGNRKHVARNEPDTEWSDLGSEWGTYEGSSDEGRHRSGRENDRRADDRLREAVSDRLTGDPHIDASGLDIAVRDAEVSLSGTISSRVLKRKAQDVAATVPGIKCVRNNLRLHRRARVLIGAGRTTREGPDRSDAGGNTPTVF